MSIFNIFNLLVLLVRLSWQLFYFGLLVIGAQLNWYKVFRLGALSISLVLLLLATQLFQQKNTEQRPVLNQALQVNYLEKRPSEIATLDSQELFSVIEELKHLEQQGVRSRELYLNLWQLMTITQREDDAAKYLQQAQAIDPEIRVAN